MEFLETIGNEIWAFFSLQSIWDIIQSGDYSKLKNTDGFASLIYPIVPILVIIELIVSLIEHSDLKIFRFNFIIYVLNRVIGRFISIGVIAFLINELYPLSFIKTEFTWYWLIYGYIIWEFSHFIYHFLAHKIRLLWCLHSTHHAPEGMNLSVTYAHFFLEAPYADLVRGGICLAAGINPPLLFFIMFIDGTWGALIHLGDKLWKNGEIGFLSAIVLSPQSHRIHHARNPIYMDTNYCNLLNIWDRVFGTYQLREPRVDIEYGITRDVKNVWDAYFGEILLLAKDVWEAPKLSDKLKYLLMPPGWHHSGNHKTAKLARKAYLESVNSAS